MHLDRAFGNRKARCDRAIPQSLCHHPHDLDLTGSQRGVAHGGFAIER